MGHFATFVNYHFKVSLYNSLIHSTNLVIDFVDLQCTRKLYALIYIPSTHSTPQLYRAYLIINWNTTTHQPRNLITVGTVKIRQKIGGPSTEYFRELSRGRVECVAVSTRMCPINWENHNYVQLQYFSNTIPKHYLPMPLISCYQTWTFSLTHFDQTWRQDIRLPLVF